MRKYSISHIGSCLEGRVVSAIKEGDDPNPLVLLKSHRSSKYLWKTQNPLYSPKVLEENRLILSEEEKTWLSHGGHSDSVTINNRHIPKTHCELTEKILNSLPKT